MKTADSRITALARLDKTPEQILAQKRAELQEQIRVLQQKTWFDRYADWRIKWHDHDFEGESDYLELSFILRSLQLGLLLLCISEKTRLLGMILLAIFEGMHFLASVIMAGSENNFKVFLKHMLYSLIFPLMPLVIRLDSEVAKKHRLKFFDPQTDQIEKLRNQIEKLTPHEVVPDYYKKSVEEARTELLGDSSELRKSERELQTHLEAIKTEKEIFKKRLQDARDDVERVDPLGAELHELIACEADLVDRLAKHQRTIALTSAILEECERYVCKLPDKLMDHELILRARSRVINANHAIEKSEEAVARHIDLVRDRLMQLAAIVAAPPRELASANPDGDMRAYFAHLEKVGEQVATLEAQKAF